MNEITKARPKMPRFEDQVAVVTGASSGIGKATAMALAEQGATVCSVARRLQEPETVGPSSCRVGRFRLHFYHADLAEEKDIAHLAARIESDFGQVDILIHSAGIFSLGPVSKAPIADFESQFRTNVLGPYALTQALLPTIRSQRGQIIFINSTAGLFGRENVSQYASTKHALKGFADSLREEVNRDGIRVLNIFLGRTATPLQAKVCELENKPYCPESLIQTEDVAAVVINALSLPRTAEITDIHMRPLARPNV